MFPRVLDLAALLAKKSFFLFGARGTGKSTLIEQSLQGPLRGALYYDLLASTDLSRLAREPQLIEQEAEGRTTTVIIDEVQKLPMLLDEVHRLIERKKWRFLLTGSSARKLRHGGANLLAGRAWTASMHPLVSREIPGFDLNQYLNRGGLPAIYPSDDFQEELRAYVNTYLREEVQAEALTRRIDHFVLFLDAIALSNGEELRYEALASDTGVQAKTIKNYVQILYDTLLAHEVSAFRKTKTRKAIATSKVYLFDLGATNTLARRGHIADRSELFGKAFEHFIMLEIIHYIAYARSEQPVQYWRSTSHFEVDCIVAPHAAIEVKGTHQVDKDDLKGIRAFKEEALVKRHFVVSQDARKRRTDDGIDILPWRNFLDALWSGALGF